MKETPIPAIDSISLPVDRDCLEDSKVTCCDIQHMLEEMRSSDGKTDSSSGLTNLSATVITPETVPETIPETTPEEEEGQS